MAADHITTLQLFSNEPLPEVEVWVRSLVHIHIGSPGNSIQIVGHVDQLDALLTKALNVMDAAVRRAGGRQAVRGQRQCLHNGYHQPGECPEANALRPAEYDAARRETAESTDGGEGAEIAVAPPGPDIESALAPYPKVRQGWQS